MGLGTAIAGSAMSLTADANDRGPGIALTWLGLVPMAASLVFLSSARHDLVNAVNVYNDALEGPIAPNAFDAPPPPPGGR